MSVYLNFVIKNNFRNTGDIEEARSYITKALKVLTDNYIGKDVPLELVSKYDDEICNMENYRGKTGGVYSLSYYDDEKVFEIMMDASDRFDIALLDGMWAVETYYDDYMFTCVNDQGQYGVWESALELARVLGEDEIWICVEDHLNNSAVAPKKFDEWLAYAEKNGIKELDLNVMKETRKMYLNHRFYGFDYDNTIGSFPIYHIKICKL